MSLQKKVLITLLCLTFTHVCVFLVFTFSNVEKILNEYIGQSALKVARTIAQINEVSHAVENGNSTYLQTFSLNVAEKTGARFVVIGDKNSIRLSHPIPERIGKEMKGGDNIRALLDGESYVSKAVGSLGLSMRGKAPIRNAKDDIIGIVSVGYMLNNVARTVASYQQKSLFYILLVLLSAAIVAWYISRQIRNSIHGLEPEEISRLFAELSTTLESMKEGIISMDAMGNITNVNRSALSVLGFSSSELLSKRHLSDVIPGEELCAIIKSHQALNDQELTINNQVTIVNQAPIYIDTIFSGAVTSFRLKGELERIHEKLSVVEQQADSLRSQAHEYSNRLQTISGLISLNEKDKALELIGQEHHSEQELISLLIDSINSRLLAGFIIGKYNRARELGITLDIDNNSQVSEIPASINREHLITILGNLLENAFEASLKHTGSGAVISMELNDLGNDFIAEITDQGPGVPKDQIDELFIKGSSTKKKPSHGYGLWIVKEQLDQCGGYLTINDNSPIGSIFTVFIPK